MANFLIFSRIGPTKYFFGCFPVRVGVFFVFLLNVAVLVADLLEHMRVFDKNNSGSGSGLVNQWITFSIQVAVSVLIFINLIVKHGLLSFLSYFVMFALTVAMWVEKMTKIVYINNLVNPIVSKVIDIHMINYALIYAYRCLAQFFIYFYCTYILYSYSQEPIAANNQAKEKFVKS